MKRLISLFIVSVILISTASCTQKNANTYDDTTPVIQNTTQDEAPNEPTIEDSDFEVEDSLITENAQSAPCRVFFRLPKYATVVKGQINIAVQDKNTLVMLCGQIKDTPKPIEKLEDSLETYLYQYINGIEQYQSWDITDYAFDIKSCENVEINGYEMCKYTGVNTYLQYGEPRSDEFVAYATQLKTNGAYFNWIVVDQTVAQTECETIEEYARGIAESIYE